MTPHITDIYKEFTAGGRIVTDSREVKQGDIFIALKGENFDGNKFARQALESGAISVVVDNPEAELNSKCKLVPDTLLFLQELAKHHRKQLNIPILGITGTNGKTTTKELCNAVLSTQYKTFATQGNFNNHIGVPLTLLSMDNSIQFGIVEMGANHPGEIKQLCEIADPDFGIITNIGRAHLEGFGSYENIIKTKNELYDHIAAKGGKLFVNASDPLLMGLSENIERTTYGNGEGLIKGEIKQTTPYLVYSLRTLKGDLYIKTKLIGGYNFDNAMAASCTGIYFGISPLDIQAAIENYRPSNLRSQLLKTENNTIILDAYNANPSSMNVAVRNFGEMQATNKIVILGEMRELGSESEKAHQELFDLTIENKFDRIFLIGNNFEHCPNNYNFITRFNNTEALIEYVKANKLKDAFILIKGSRGNKLERIVEYL